MNAIHLVHPRAGTAVALAFLFAACAPSAGVSPLPSSASPVEPSVVQSPEPSPPPSASPTVAPSVVPSVEPSAVPSASPTPAASGTTIVRAYFRLDDGAAVGSCGAACTAGGLVPVLRTLPRTVGVARAAMNALLDGPTTAERGADPALTTSVPASATLLGISVDGGTATVDLSGSFASAGSTNAQIARVAQVVYTLTQFSNVHTVRFEVEGTPIAVPDGSGTSRTDAVGRADFRQLLPAIFVDRPTYGAAIGNPARVAGLANVFEATFRVRLLDGSGRTLVDEQVMASCGTGCWGTFDVDLSYDVAKAQWGTLRVYDLSAKDGSRENVREEPVWLVPAA
jgi:hypothetical protein